MFWGNKILKSKNRIKQGAMTTLRPQFKKRQKRLVLDRFPDCCKDWSGNRVILVMITKKLRKKIVKMQIMIFIWHFKCNLNDNNPNYQKKMNAKVRFNDIFFWHLREDGWIDGWRDGWSKSLQQSEKLFTKLQQLNL